MKFKRLTKQKSNGQIALVKKEINFDMLSPVIAKVLLEALEQLSTLEQKVEDEKLLEVPFSIKSVMNLDVDSKAVMVEVKGYEITEKDMNVLLETKEGISMKIQIKEAMQKLKKKCSVDVS